jgi:hypothetical protein
MLAIQAKRSLPLGQTSRGESSGVSEVEQRHGVVCPGRRPELCVLIVFRLAGPAGKPRVAVVHFRKEHGGGCVWPPSSTQGLSQTQQLQN